MTVIGSAELDIKAKTDKLAGEITAKTTDAVKKAQSAVKPIKIDADTEPAKKSLTSLGNVARAVAATALIVAFKKAIDAGEDYASSVRRIASVTGGTAQESSKLAFVLGRIGIDASNATRPLGILSKNIQQGGASFQKYFTNAEIARFRTQSLIKTLPELAARYRALGTATERTTFLQNVFGRGGAELRRLLSLTATDFNKLSAEATRFGLVLSTKNVDAFKRFSDQQREVGQAFKGLQVQIGLLTLPVLEKLNTVLIKAVTGLTNLPGPIQSVAGVAGVAAIGVGKFGQGITAAIDVMERGGGAAKRVGGAFVTLGQNLTRIEGASRLASVGLGLVGAAATGLALGALIFVIAKVVEGFAESNKRARDFADSIAALGGPEVKGQLTALRKELVRNQQAIEDLGLGTKTKVLDNETLKRLSQLGERNRGLTDAIKERTVAEKAAIPGTKEHADALVVQADNALLLSGALTGLSTVAVADASAHDLLARSIQGVDINSQAGIAAQVAYAKALVDAQIAAAGGELEEKELAEVRKDAAGKARKAAQEIVDAARKQADEVTAAHDKEIESFNKLLSGFDLLPDKAKVTLKEFRKNITVSDEFVLQFVSDLQSLAAQGAQALAQKFKDEGPAAAKAARQAVLRLASNKDGLGTLEAETRRSFVIAKVAADAQLDTWPDNFGGKSKKAGKAAFDALEKELREIAKLHPELTVAIKLELDRLELQRIKSSIGAGGFIPVGGIPLAAKGGDIRALQPGGGVRVGEFALVGEKGPELVRFGRTGHVFSNDDTIALLRQIAQSLSSTQGGTNTFNINSGQLNQEALANAIAYRLARQTRR